jgi:hypothetical protein
MLNQQKWGLGQLAGHSPDCPVCGRAPQYWEVTCSRCSNFLGFPNRRAAEGERVELSRRYDAARAEAVTRGLSSLVETLEAVAHHSLPVISMGFEVCDDILRPDKYRNYHQRVDSGERNPAAAENHADREIVGARLFPNYHHHIQYAALSPDGSGLPTYGAVAVRWRVTSTYLGRRASLLEDNSYTFFEHNHLGELGATIPSGYRAVWEDRVQLVVAKVAERLTIAMEESSLSRLLLRPTADKKNDEFVEVAIYADGGLETEDVDRVTLTRAATTREERHRLRLIRDMCASRGIQLVE